MGWAVEAVADDVEHIRPRFRCEDQPALWVTERGGRVKPAEINARFVAYHDALGLPKALTPHSLRHSWVTHLTEGSVDRRFLQEAVGHRCDTSILSIFTCPGIHEYRPAQGDCAGFRAAGVKPEGHLACLARPSLCSAKRRGGPGCLYGWRGAGPCTGHHKIWQESGRPEPTDWLTVPKRSPLSIHPPASCPGARYGPKA